MGLTFVAKKWRFLDRAFMAAFASIYHSSTPQKKPLINRNIIYLKILFITYIWNIKIFRNLSLKYKNIIYNIEGFD